MAEHPITPPPELMQQWLELWPQEALVLAARWGADQELEACIKWLNQRHAMGISMADVLHKKRRPKPSLKKEALILLAQEQNGIPLTQDEVEVIRRALEALPQ